MTSDPTLAAFEAERDRVARLTRRGVGMPMAGLVYWLAVAVLLRRLPMDTALVISFAATGAVFPLGALLTRLLGGDLMAKSGALTSLAILLAAMQLLYWPVIIVVFRHAPTWTPFCLAALFGSHFLPYSWLYRGWGYGLLAVSTTVVLCAAALATRSSLFLTAPLLAAGCYAVSIVVLLAEVAGDKRRSA